MVQERVAQELRAAQEAEKLRLAREEREKARLQQVRMSVTLTDGRALLVFLIPHKLTGPWSCIGGEMPRYVCAILMGWCSWRWGVKEEAIRKGLEEKQLREKQLREQHLKEQQVGG